MTELVYVTSRTGIKTTMQFLLLCYIYVPNRRFGKSCPETRAIKLTVNLRGLIFSRCQLASPQHVLAQDLAPGWGGHRATEDQKKAQKRRHRCHEDPPSCQRGWQVPGRAWSWVEIRCLFIAENI